MCNITHKDTQTSWNIFFAVKIVYTDSSPVVHSAVVVSYDGHVIEYVSWVQLVGKS